MDRLPSLIGGVFDSFKALVKRVGLHFLALCAGLFISGAGLTGTICAYVGIICLFPLGFDPRKIRFLVPFAVSAGQFALTCLWGLPPALALFWAGAQTWLIQAFILRFGLGWAWTAAPALLLGLALGYNSHHLPLPLLLFFGLCTAGGVAAYEFLTARENKKRLDKAAAQNATLDANGPGSITANNTRAAAPESEQFIPFRNSVNQLLGKRDKLPEPLQKHLNALTLSTGGMIACMNEDAEDVPGGTRFLNRYLPAVHKVIDEYIRLTGDGRAHADLQEALARTDEVLGRMVTAFHEEHGNLLRNDTMRFTADLNVLDKLLKMDGR